MSSECPWAFMDPAVLSFCEAQRCGWVREPLNTASSLGLFGVGLYWLIQQRRSPQLSLMGMAAILIAVTTAFYHASSSRVGELFDLGSMYLLATSMVLFNIDRLGWFKITKFRTLAVTVSAAGISLLFVWREIGAWIYDLILIVALSLELRIFMARKKLGASTSAWNYRFFAWALATYVVAQIIWILDYKKIYCSPESLIYQGHAVWHLLSAVTLALLAKFYSQFYGNEEIAQAQHFTGARRWRSGDGSRP